MHRMKLYIFFLLKRTLNKMERNPDTMRVHMLPMYLSYDGKGPELDYHI